MQHFGFPIETIIVFFGVILLSVYLDLFAHRHTKEISVKDASLWSFFWIGLALAFYAYLWVRFDKDSADLYLAGYVLEKSLSVDNLMVFMAIFSSFGIVGKMQHRILYWGIVGALIFRGAFVVAGTAIFSLSPMVGFAFAAFVIWSGWKMWSSSGDDDEEIEDYSNHWSVRWTGKLMPVYTKLFGDRFVVKHSELNAEQLVSTTRKGLRYVTPAFLCLMAIETSDVAFAFDSVPAVIAVTQEPLLVYAAMIFAILGLRSLYFILAALTKYLVHLEKAVIALLFFIGIKMAIHSWNATGYLPDVLHFSWTIESILWMWSIEPIQLFSFDIKLFENPIILPEIPIHISPNTSLFIVLSVLAAGVIASLIFPEKSEENEEKK